MPGDCRRMPHASRKIILWLCVGMCLTLLLSACDTAKSSAHATHGPLPDNQQTLRTTLIPGAGANDTVTLDPALVNDTSSLEPVSLVFPGLFTLDAQLQPELWVAAQAPDITQNGLTYTFHLRPNLAFTDGEAIDSSAFAYAINRSLNPCTDSPAAFYLYAIKDAQTFNQEICNTANGSVKAAPGQATPTLDTLIGNSIIIQDPQTLQITLEQPTPYFLTELAYPVAYAVPQSLITQYGAAWTGRLAALHFGGNLFEVTQWNPSISLTLQRNSLFWGNHPKLRQIVFSISASSQAAYNSYQAGQQDETAISDAQYQTLSQQSSADKMGLLTSDYYGMNWGIAPFDDLRMRQAFADALNKQSLVTDALHGAALPTNHIVPLGMPGYNADLQGSGGTQDVAGNPTLAGQLESQYVSDICHGNVASCPPVTLTLPSGDAEAAAEAQAALSMWRSALPGYPISITTRDAKTIQSALAAHTLQFWFASWTLQYPDPQNALSMEFLPMAQDNSGKVDQADATALMRKADTEQDPSARLKDYQAAEQLLVTFVACVPLQQREAFYLVRASVKEYATTALGIPRLDIWQQIYLAK